MYRFNENYSEFLNSKFLSVPSNFETIALQIFRYQAENNSVYNEFLNYLKINISKVAKLQEIPFLPIELFKTHKILINNKVEQTIFSSSGTTGLQTSKHYVSNLEIYRHSFINCFTEVYGNIEQYCILALLPSYLERSGSSLIFMVAEMIKMSQHKASGFYLNNYSQLAQQLHFNERNGIKTLLLGVSFALWEFAEQYNLELKNTIIMETGGMKGRRPEITREELHEILCKAFDIQAIHSEYGMTELLSQAYSTGDGVFEMPSSMQILIRDVYDPFAYQKTGKSGGINVIDLANINSCAFIETQDLGILLPNKKFKVLGRFDQSDVRGCNLMTL